MLDYRIRDKSLHKWPCLEQQREQVLPVETWFQREKVGENGARLCESVIRTLQEGWVRQILSRGVEDAQPLLCQRGLNKVILPFLFIINGSMHSIICLILLFLLEYNFFYDVKLICFRNICEASAVCFGVEWKTSKQKICFLVCLQEFKICEIGEDDNISRHLM